MGLTRASSGLAMGLAALAAMASAPSAQAGLTPALERRLARVAPDVHLPVTVTLAQQVDEARYAGRPTELIRALRRTARLTQAPLVNELDGPVRQFWLNNALAVTADPAEILRLAGDPAVAEVDIDRAVRLLGGQARAIQPYPDSGAGGWGVAAIEAPAVWSDYGITGAGVRVGSIDTGADPRNPDLQGRIAAWHDFVAGQPTPYDDNGHGTHTIGTMVGGAARGGPIGVAPGATALVAKAVGADGTGTGSAILAAAEWMADPDGNPATADWPVVVNNSWTTGDANDPWFRTIVRRWRALGMVAVFAAGNAGPGPSTVQSPASYPESIAVGATDRDGSVAEFSSRGPVTWNDADGTGPAAGTLLPKPDLAAPGVAVVSSFGAGYLAYSGTSVAAPHVSGVVALMKQANPNLGGAEIEELLRRSARNLGPAGPDPDSGWGLVSARAAVDAALGSPPDTALVVTPPAVTAQRALTYQIALTGATTYRSRVDGAPWGPLTTDTTLRVATGEGRHVIEVQAVSPRGVPDPTPSRDQVTVDFTPPEISFTWRTAGRHVTFFARLLDRLSGPDPSSLVWSFGDGASARGPSVTHAFRRTAPRRVRASVRDLAGNEAAVSRMLRPGARAAEAPLLRSVTARRRVSRRARTLVVEGRLTQHARVRATLVRVGAARRGTRTSGVSAVSRLRPPGRFRIALSLRSLSPGSYRLTVAAAGRGERRLRPQATRRVQVTPAARNPGGLGR
jgi:subtilisin family serine protease